jgi:prepilin-type N-terminal cleavage/methylation domain-containing protein
MQSRHHQHGARGYSLIELLVVLAIISVLSIAAVTTVGNRPAGAVRAVMDEVEGVLAAAHKRTASSPGDITLITGGVWGSTASLTFTGANAPGDSFQYVSGTRVYDYAGIACGTNWADGAIASLRGVVPTNQDPFLDALSRPLFTGSANPGATGVPFVINGYSKRFSQGFYIAVVGMRGGTAFTSGPVGVIVVPGGGNAIYKFYRGNSTETWRRL